MQTYQPYYPQMNNFNNYSQQTYNPQQAYMDRMAQYQQNMNGTQIPLQNQQYQQMPIGISGKVVQNPDSIAANDVPMDGSMAFFPMQDMSQILAKSWNADGTIRTIVFKPVLDGNPSNLSQTEEKLKIGLSEDVTQAFMKRFDDIEKRLDDFGTSLNKTTNKSSTSRTKKEDETE